MVCIYILRLEEEKYYVGKTNNPEFRLDSHFNANGSEWTKLYKPINIVEIKNNCDDYDEDKYTIIYMNKYGINNVRGGSFVSVILTKAQNDTLEKMISGATNKCFLCAGDHFAKECEENKDFVWVCECGREFLKESSCAYHSKYCKAKNKLSECCFRCGRTSHYVRDCYAKKHINGYYL